MYDVSYWIRVQRPVNLAVVRTRGGRYSNVKHSLHGKMTQNRLPRVCTRTRPQRPPARSRSPERPVLSSASSRAPGLPRGATYRRKLQIRLCVDSTCDPVENTHGKVAVAVSASCRADQMSRHLARWSADTYRAPWGHRGRGACRPRPSRQFPGRFDTARQSHLEQLGEPTRPSNCRTRPPWHRDKVQSADGAAVLQKSGLLQLPVLLIPVPLNDAA